VASALGKARALLTPRALALVDHMRATVGARFVGAKLQLGASRHVETIQRALAEGRALDLRYHSLSRDAETERRVDPYHLTYYGGGLYLVGHCHLRGDVRIFAVERIRAAAVLRQPFQRPAGFDPEAYLRGAWGIVRGDVVPVRAVFSRTAAPHVRDRLWHPSQRLRELPGGRLEVRLEVADTVEVRRWLLGFGAEAEVLEPLALREALRAEAERLARALAPRRRAPGGVGSSTAGQVRASEATLPEARSARRKP
jgi:predicted DNA-binding transcriptional regulator YafY